MKIFKKLLLASGLIGLIGSFGLGQKVSAASDVNPVTVTVTVDGTEVSWEWESEAGEAEYDYEEVTKAVISTSQGTVCTITEEDLLDGGPVDLLDYINVSAGSPNEYSGKVTVTLSLKYVDADDHERPGTAKGTSQESMTSLYKQTVTSGDFSKGTIYADGEVWTSPYIAYYPAGDILGLEADPLGVYSFINWKEDPTKKQVDTVTVRGSATYTAVFGAKATSVSILAKGPRDSSYMGEGDTVELYVGEKLTTDKILVPTDADAFTGSWKVSSAGYINSNFVAVKATTTPVELYYELKNSGETTSIKSGVIYVKILDNSVKVTTKGKKPDKDEETDFVNYLTTGYEMKFYATNSADADNMKWTIVEGGDYAEITNQSWSSSNKKQTVTIKGKGDIDAGEKKEVKLACTVNGVYAYIDSDDKSVLTKTIYIYSKPSLSYSDRTLRYKAPEKVNSGTTSGKDSSLSDSTETPIDSVKGVKIQVLVDGTSLGFTSSAKDKGSGTSEYTIEASTVENIITNLNNKFSKTCDVEFRAYPCNSDGKFNKNIYKSVTVKVYKVNVIVESASSKTSGGGTAKAYALPVAAIAPVGNLVGTATTTASSKDYVYYGLEGQTIDLASQADASGDKGIMTAQFKTLTNNVVDVATTKRIVVSSTEGLNTYRGVLGTKTATDEAGYDKVPKTGQSNVFVLLMAAVVVAAVFGGLYVYNKKNKENI
ncbi:MAG: LPXTG cell wall anchor domain-containing protein [Lachnospiraceae bacterium]|nr:LPXTG cell wall anchor domain-containing protein [Lachnospiraceae bacterium]